MSVFSFVKVNGGGNSDRTETGKGKACWGKKQTQANGTDRASCYEKEEGESLEPKGSHPLAKLLRPKGMVASRTSRGPVVLQAVSLSGVATEAQQCKYPPNFSSDAEWICSLQAVFWLAMNISIKRQFWCRVDTYCHAAG